MRTPSVITRCRLALAERSGQFILPPQQECSLMATDDAELPTDGTPIEPGPNSVGFVKRQSVALFEPPHPLTLAGGGELGPVTIAYETYGELSPQKDNAIFVCHALTGDAHVAGWHTPRDRKPGWWDEFVGPGKG